MKSDGAGRAALSMRFAPTGQGRMIYDDRLARAARAVGKVETFRASHVEPEGGGWTADMAPVGGPVLRAASGEPFTTRAEALAAERAWLEERAIPLPTR